MPCWCGLRLRKHGLWLRNHLRLWLWNYHHCRMRLWLRNNNRRVRLWLWLRDNNRRVRLWLWLRDNNRRLRMWNHLRLWNHMRLWCYLPVPGTNVLRQGSDEARSGAHCPSESLAMQWFPREHYH